MDIKEKKRIAALEDELIGEKPWQLKGEVGAHSRPINSLLFEDVNFEQRTKAPKITPETTESLEELIKLRIKDNKFDDPIRKHKTPTAPTTSREVEVNSEKSKMSLAQVYEHELVSKVAPGKEKEGPEREVKIRLRALIHKLDALVDR